MTSSVAQQLGTVGDRWGCPGSRYDQFQNIFFQISSGLDVLHYILDDSDDESRCNTLPGGSASEICS